MSSFEDRLWSDLASGHGGISRRRCARYPDSGGGDPPIW